MSLHLLCLRDSLITATNPRLTPTVRALQEFLVKYVQHLFDVLQHLRITAHLDIGPDTAGGQPAAGTDCTKNQSFLLPFI